MARDLEGAAKSYDRISSGSPEENIWKKVKKLSNYVSFGYYCQILLCIIVLVQSHTRVEDIRCAMKNMHDMQYTIHIKTNVDMIF